MKFTSNSISAIIIAAIQVTVFAVLGMPNWVNTGAYVLTAMIYIIESQK